MHRSPLVRRPLSLLLGFAILALPQLAGPARAADKFTKVTFDTVDGVTLQGTFYPSAKGKDEPTVMLLHKIGGDSHKDGWDALAAALNDKGYSVLSFDFRGHGNSTAVDPAKFWDQRLHPWNAKPGMIRGGALDKGKPRDSINREAFSPAYYPYLLNDIAAAKMFLDDRNDAGDCNSRSLILIGAEDGAALGSVWMYSEWNRFGATRVTNLGPARPPLVGNIEKDAEGKDQYCGLWLTLATRLGTNDKGISVPQAVRTAVKFVGKEKKKPMGFLYGEKDETGAKHAEDFLRLIKGDLDPSEKGKFPFTDKRAIKDSKLAGSALLRKDLGTQELILTYLEKLREKNIPSKWSKIEADRTAYVWTFPGSAMRLAKEDKGKTLEPIPLGLLGLGQ
jgi:pimeloyl-ACP methyl ester carboxylesterase